MFVTKKGSREEEIEGEEEKAQPWLCADALKGSEQ